MSGMKTEAPSPINSIPPVMGKDKKRTRGPTVMYEITRMNSQGQKIVVKYNDDGQPIGVNATKLKSFIGSCVRHHVPITYDNWKSVPSEMKERIYMSIQGGFVVEPNTKEDLMKIAGVAFRQFKSTLTTKYVLPNKDHPECLENPPEIYSQIEKEHWDCFVESRLSKNFEQKSKLQQQRRVGMKDDHQLSQEGYTRAEELDETSAPPKKKLYFKSTHSDDVQSQALGTLKDHGRVQRVGDVVPPAIYFHKPKQTTRLNKVQREKVDEEILRLYERIKELESQIKQGSCIQTSEHDSCSDPVDEEMEIDVEADIKKVAPRRKEVGNADGTVRLQKPPVSIRYMMLHGDSMKEQSSISITFPIYIFGVSRCYIMKEELLQFCHMREVSDSCISAYIAYLHTVIVESDALGLYMFMDPSTISFIAGSQEMRARKLSTPFLAADPDELVIIPYSFGGDWVLVVVNPTKNVAFSLDPTRYCIQDDIVAVVDMAFEIYQSKIRSPTNEKLTWKPLKCPRQSKSKECGYYIMRYMREIIRSEGSSIIDVMLASPSTYTQSELDDVRIEWAEFVGSHIDFV